VRGVRGKDERRISRARSLRRALTQAESKLWAKLRNRQLGGFKFTRQEPIGSYYADFVCRDRKLIVEWMEASMPRELRIDGATAI